MKTKRLVRPSTWTALLGVLAGVGLVTCGPPPPPEVDQLEISGAVDLTSLGETVQLQVQAFDKQGHTIEAVTATWISSDEAVATVDETGLVTARGNGTTQITAQVGAKSKAVPLRVIQRARRVVVSPASATMRPDETQPFTAEAFDARDNRIAGASAFWSSSNPSKVPISSAGVASAVAVTSPLTVTLTATIDQAQGTAQLTVDPGLPAVSSVTVAPASPAALASIGDTLALTAVARAPDGSVLSGLSFSWSSSNTAVATVDGNGLVTAVANGTAIVSANARGVEGSVVIRVAQVVSTVDVAVRPPATSAQLSSLGATVQLDAVAKDARGHAVPSATFTWSSDSTVIASVDASGLVTAVRNGSTRIQAISGGISGSLNVTVAQVVTSVSVTASSSTTLTSIGASLVLTGIARDARGNAVLGESLTWLSDDTAVATVSLAGVATAEGNGNTIIRARAGNGIEGSIAVSVVQTPASVAVSAASSTALTSLGDTVQLLAVVRDGRGNSMPSEPLTWITDSGAVAGVSASGLVTATGNGSTSVHARTRNGTDGSIGITVSQVPASVAIGAAASTTLGSFGDTVQLNAVARDARNNVIAGATFTWRSEDSAVASVSSSGLATAIANGATRVHAMTPNMVDGSISVNVTQVVASVSVTAAGSTTLASLGDTVTLSAQARDARGNAISGAVFIWSSDASGVASVSNGVVTAVSNGTANISARALNGVTGSLGVTVSQVPVSVTVTAGGSTSFSSVGDTAQLTAQARDARDNLIPSATFTWRSDATGIATVSTTGLVTARGNGSTLIHARTSNGTDGSLTVTVAQVVVSVDVSPGSTAVPQGLTLNFTATARDARGNLVPGTPVTAWVSGDETIASIDASGVVTGVTPGGPVTIAATMAGVTGRAQLWTAAVYDWDFAVTFPQVVNITRGQWVSWRNSGTCCTHSVVADDGAFDTGLLNPGQVSAPIQINLAAGSYGYHCVPHVTSMVGTLNVSAP